MHYSSRACPILPLLLSGNQPISRYTIKYTGTTACYSSYDTMCVRSASGRGLTRTASGIGSRRRMHKTTIGHLLRLCIDGLLEGTKREPCCVHALFNSSTWFHIKNLQRNVHAHPTLERCYDTHTIILSHKNVPHRHKHNKQDDFV